MPEHFSKLIKFYGGINETFRRMDKVQKELKKMVVSWSITKEECDMRIKMVSDFKRKIQKDIKTF